MIVKKWIANNITSDGQLRAALGQESLNRPGKIVTAHVQFGTVRFYVRDRQPTTDSPDTVQTYQQDGGFWKNGQVVSPTATWLKRYNFKPILR